MVKVSRNLTDTCWYDPLNSRIVSVIGMKQENTFIWWYCVITDLDDNEEPDPTESYYGYLTQKQIEAMKEMEGME